MEITIQKHSLRLDTKRYTLEDIHKEVMEDFGLLISLGCEDLLNKEVRIKWGKKVRAYGTCKRLGFQSSTGKTLYEIQINREYIAVANSKEVHNTIMHECIHCVDGCMNHGEKWKAIARKVNSKFDFTTIKRTGYDEAYHAVMETKYKYEAICNKCGTAYRWMRQSRIYTSCAMGKARCNCGGKEFTCRPIH